MTDKELAIVFAENVDAQYADEYAMWIEELASKYEVTCDYIIQEFIVD
jgi:hypothetical protein